MLRRTLIGATAALLITGITGCGFQLRGQLDVPDHLRQLQLVQNSNHHRLTASLVETMRLNQLEVTANAPYRLEIIKAVDKRRTVSLDRNANVDEYELTLEVEFQVSRTGEEKPVLKPQRMSTERVYTYDADAATAASEQEELLKQEMSDDLARQIVRRYLKISDAP